MVYNRLMDKKLMFIISMLVIIGLLAVAVVDKYNQHASIANYMDQVCVEPSERSCDE